MIVLLTGLLLAQEREVLSTAERLADIDPEIRATGLKQAAALWKEQQNKVIAFSQSKDENLRAAALAAMSAVGKFDPEKLFAIRHPQARTIACDLLPEKKELIPELQRLLEEKDLALRLAAARALGKVRDPALRNQILQEFQKTWMDNKFDSTDVLAYYVMAHWYPQGYSATIGSYVNSREVDTAETAIACLCNLPEPEVSGSLIGNASGALRNEKISLRLRELLLRLLARVALHELPALLTVENKQLRSQVVEYLDQGLKDPLLTRPLVEIARQEAVQKLDDGRDPATPLTTWIERWLKRLTGEDGDINKYEEWVKAKYRSLVDQAVDRAIKAGVDALRRVQNPDGSWSYHSGYPVGVTALGIYTLLKCDVEPNDKALTKALEYMLPKDPEGTYSAALYAMALATAIEKTRAKKITTAELVRWQKRLQEIADILVASQKRTGGWHYDIRIKTGTGLQGGGQNQDSYDFSNTQFAVLGLRAAANAGAKVPRGTWERALALYEKHQNEKDGGWPYIGATQPNQPVGSSHAMTAAGAYGWMICKTSLDPKFSPETIGRQDRVTRAIEYLDRNWKVDPIALADAYYWLYSLERMCMAGKIDRIGTHDWYMEGAQWLLIRQRTDGTWSGNYGHTVDTCFALLFLKRAYISTPYIETGDPKKK